MRAAYVTPLSLAPPVVLGAIDVQGHVLPVFNLRYKFRLPERTVDPADQFLIARTAQRTVVLVIDAAHGVLELPAAAMIEGVLDALWGRLSEFIAQNTGLHFPPERRSDLQRGFTAAAAEFGFADSAHCADWLLSASLTRPQLHTLASHLTVGETYFFRERKTFDAPAQRILPELFRRRRRRGREQRLRL